MSLHLGLAATRSHAYRRPVRVPCSTSATVAKDFSALPTCGSVRPLASQLALRDAQTARDDG